MNNIFTNTRVHALACILMAALLSACTGQPVRVTHYTLPHNGESPASDMASNSSTPVFIETTIDTTSYLAAPGIAYQTSELEIESAYSHRWADSLKAQLGRTLREQLLSGYGGYRFVNRINDNAGQNKAYRIQVSIDRFGGRYDGKAIVSGQWLIRDAKNEYLAGEQFDVQPPLQRDGYEALVKSLADGWQEVTGAIAAELEKLRG